MAYTDIDKPSEHFETKIWTGNGSSQNITGLNFKPDFVWIKDRDDTSSHAITDAVRGNTKYLMSNDSYQEETITDRVTSFNSDGYSLGSSAGVNQNGAGNVGWNWKANGAGSANTDGGINSTVSVNNTAGFSIVKYGTGTGSATTVGHGMNTAPNFIIIKPLGTIQTGNWMVGGDNIDNTWNNIVELNTTFAKANDTAFNDTAPTSSVFSVGNNNTNRSGENYIAWCFTEKKGFSKFSSFVGNGNSDGTFIYTGFKPAFVMVKSSTLTQGWGMWDNKRTPSNVSNKILVASANVAELTGFDMDINSNGFKLRSTDANSNQSGATYIYMCFAESPFTTSTGIPTTAR